MIEKHLHVKPRFTGFDVSHLHKHAVSYARHGHQLRSSSAHYKTVKRLGAIDGYIRRRYPFLNVSVKEKYLGHIHLAEGIGAADDGDMPTKVIRDYQRKHS